MAKDDKKKRRRSNGFTLPLSVIIGMVPLAVQMNKGWKNEGLTGMGKEAVFSMTGYHMDTSTFYLPYLKNGAIPIVLGLVAHKVASRIGLNRVLASAKVPLLRI